MLRSQDRGRRVSVRLTGTPDARNHILVGEVRTVPREQHFDAMYRRNSSMMCIVVLSFGQSALRKNQCGELTCLVARMKHGKRFQNPTTFLCDVVVAFRRFLVNNVRHVEVVLVPVACPPPSCHHLHFRCARVSADPPSKKTHDRRLDVQRRRLRCETRRRKQLISGVPTETQGFEPGSQFGYAVFGRRNRKRLSCVDVFHARTLAIARARLTAHSCCFRIEMRGDES